MKKSFVVYLILANMFLAGGIILLGMKEYEYVGYGLFAAAALFFVIFIVGLSRGKRKAATEEIKAEMTEQKKIAMEELMLEGEKLQQDKDELAKNLGEKNDELYVLNQNLKSSDQEIMSLRNSIEELQKEKAKIEEERKKDMFLAFLPGEGRETRLEKIDAVEVCKEVVREMAPYASAANIHIIVNSDEEKVWMLANRERIRIMFRNVIDNSVKYMKKAGILNIVITTLENDVFIVLRDNGEGIDKDLTEKIFELNYQGPNRVSGNGLGLTQARAIAEYYDGSIYAKSDNGEGMATYIKIPAI